MADVISPDRAGDLAQAYQALARAHLRYAQATMQTREFPGDLSGIEDAERDIRRLREDIARDVERHRLRD